MSRETVGVDLGSSSIKLVRCRSGMKGIEVANVFELPLPLESESSPPAGPIGVDSLVQQTLHRWNGFRIGSAALQGDVVMAVPGDQVLTCILTLPSTDSEKLEQMIRYEVEGHIPLPLEEVVVAHHLLSSNNGQVQVFAAAASKTLMRRQLEWFGKMGLEPKAAELEALALYSAFCYLEKERDGIHVVMDLGASKTTLCLIENGKLLGVRTILSGGRALTRALKEKFGVSDEEAERAKQRGGLEGDKDQTYALMSVLDALTAEVKRTIHLYTASRGKEIRSIHLCGGGARLRGLSAYLTQQFALEPAFLTVSSPDSGAVSGGEIYAQGLGLAVKGLLRGQGSQLNFRSGEFAYAKEAAEVRGRWGFLAIAAVVVLLLIVANGYFRYASKESRYRELKAQVRAAFQSAFPQVRTVVDEIEQAKATVAELNKKAAFFGSGDLTALEVLAEISRQVPKETRFDVQDFSAENDKVQIEAETNSFDAVDKIKADLERFSKFKEVNVSDAKVSADQSKVRFRIAITLTEKL
jgi:type IV pilus assembly protein PilM